jgi:hypothetical protein
VEVIVKFGGDAVYDYQLGKLNPEPPGPLWLQELLGDDFLCDIVGVNLYSTQVTDAGVSKLQQALPNCRIEH